MTDMMIMSIAQLTLCVFVAFEMLFIDIILIWRLCDNDKKDK